MSTLAETIAGLRRIAEDPLNERSGVLSATMADAVSHLEHAQRMERAVRAVEHQLTHGEASDVFGLAYGGLLRDLKWCRARLRAALAGEETPQS